MDTVLKQSKKKHRSPTIRWKLFFATLFPTLVLIMILWVAQTVLLGVFYRSIKTDELKQTTENVVNNIENSDIENRIFFLSSNGNINIRVIETSAFEYLYTTGEAFDSVTYGWGPYGMLDLYEEAQDGGGELVRYYSEGEEFDEMQRRFDENSSLSPTPDNGENANDADENDIPAEEKFDFRSHFKHVPAPSMFENTGKHSDLLYAKIATLSDGSEIMVVADTRISPLDSMVATLKTQLVFCTIVTIIVSLIVSFFIARHISKPIEKINKSAKVLASGDFGARFEGKGYREIEELNDTLNFASSELGKVENLRRELMANVSHDMRTPLTMIVGYSEVMRDIPGENNPENVQVIIDEASRLTNFVNSVLDLSKLQNGMEKFEFCELDITAILESSAERYRKLLGDTGLCVNLDVTQHAYVMADETKITQVIHNLCDNAVNYAKSPKEITIRQTVTKNTVKIEISDNGEGIDPKELPYIWDRYYKSDKSHKRNVAGSGIGLSIVKEILKKHSARFGVESKENIGSTFWFELPCKIAKND